METLKQLLQDQSSLLHLRGTGPGLGLPSPVVQETPASLPRGDGPKAAVSWVGLGNRHDAQFPHTNIQQLDLSF